MESEYQTVGQMYERLRLMIRQHNDTGFLLAMTDAVLEPRNPFEPASKRRPKSVVAITLILVLVLALIFLYFSFQHAISVTLLIRIFERDSYRIILPFPAQI